MTTTPLSAVNHLLDRMAHTLRILGAVDFPPEPIASFVMPPPFETGLSMALRAVRIEQDTARIMYGGSDTVLLDALKFIAANDGDVRSVTMSKIAREALAKAGAA